jgi:hypothetical protein
MYPLNPDLLAQVNDAATVGVIQHLNRPETLTGLALWVAVDN